jgi:hemerythrin
MPLQWNRALSTGIDWQDDQHKQLFNHLSNLIDAMNEHHASTEIGKMVYFLEEYIEFHFKAEKDCMQETRFPDIEFHLRSHEKFSGIVRTMVQSFDKQGPSTVIVMKAQELVSDWVLHHIPTMDKKLAEHILACQAQKK